MPANRPTPRASPRPSPRSALNFCPARKPVAPRNSSVSRAPAADTRIEPFAATRADGAVLRGRVVLPEGGAGALILFNAGTAAKLHFYRRFLDYFAAHGIAYALWDYRGFGDNRPDTLKGCRYGFADFGTLDIPAVKAYLRDTYPELPLAIVAHSYRHPAHPGVYRVGGGVGCRVR